MIPSIVEVTTAQKYILNMQFSNGEKRSFDMSPYIDIGIFRELRDYKMFATAKKSFDTIEWDNGADIDPESLYTESVLIEK